jgi:hypothetical protein
VAGNHLGRPCGRGNRRLQRSWPLGIGLGLAFAWIGFCIFQGTIILEQQQYAVIERLGKYQTVYFRGWKVLVIGVDKIRGEIGDMRAKEYQLYADERKTEH